MRHALALAVAFLCAALSGCSAPQYVVNVSATPPGATLTQHDGSQLGEAPTYLTYQHDPLFVSNGCMLVQGVTATWTSGAKASTAPTLRLCNGAAYQYRFHVNLERPKTAPGLDTDLDVAKMIIQQRLDAATLREQQRIVQEQQALQAWAEAAGALGYLLGSQ